MSVVDHSCMCGILGIVQTDGQRLDAPSNRVLEGMLRTLAERGPDGRGYHSRGPIGFGHHRLAIRDPTSGPQPWFSEDGNCVLVYNGELYNDDLLRKELSSDFHFESNCDTEVILAAYLKWGRFCKDRFRGMFSFGLYDFRNETLWLVRDRFGIKPLYFSSVGNQFIFASRIATILEHPRISKEPDWNSVSHYLSTTRLTLGRRTLYRGIHQLQPAEELTLTRGFVQISRYWDYPAQRADVSYDDAVDQLQHSLEETVQIRLKSDVEVGLFLSGGVDSSTIGALASKASPTALYATCATTPADNLADPTHGDEPAHAINCANEIGAKLHPVTVSGEQYLNVWQQLVRDFRSPLSTPSDVMIYEIAKAAKRRVGVVLGGEGADELLCGYEVAHWSGHDYDATINDRGNSAKLESIHRQYGRNQFNNEADHYFALNSLVPRSLKSRILNSEISRLIDNDEAMLDHYQCVYDQHRELSMVEKNAIVLHRINLEALLARLDVTTMHAGLEARVPFTDHRLVESVFQLPFQYRIDALNGTSQEPFGSADLSVRGRLRSKRILRSVANRLLPSRLANRKKASFPTGVARWFQADWCGWLSTYMSQSPFAEYLLSARFRHELIVSPQAVGMWLWPITNLCLWGDAEFFKDFKLQPRRSPGFCDVFSQAGFDCHMT